MKSASETVRGKVNVALLDKADRLFRNDDAGIWTEILQNARRAGATSVDLAIKPGEPMENHCVVTVQDDGHGIEDFQSLLTLGTSDWSTETQCAEDPAGMGFFSLCRSDVEVYSGDRLVKLTPAVFLGKAEAHIEPGGEFIQGTRLRFTRQSSRDALIAALKQVTEFCPLEVRLEGQSLPRHDFLNGALYRELIDGIEVGFGVAFEHGYSYHDTNWNFYGTRIHRPFGSFTGLLDENKRSVSTIYARFNVLETGRVKLQLPDRRGVIEDEFLKEFERKARAAAYRFFQTQSQHVLPFRNWKEARALGIDLPEAAHLLTSWHAESRDESIEPLLGNPEAGIITDLTNVILADRDLLNAHTLDAALHSGANFPGTLYREEPGYAGYAWYDRLPRIADTTVFIDGVSFEEYELPRSGAERPVRIEIEVAIKKLKEEARSLRLPVLDSCRHKRGQRDQFRGGETESLGQRELGRTIPDRRFPDLGNVLRRRRRGVRQLGHAGGELRARRETNRKRVFSWTARYSPRDSSKCGSMGCKLTRRTAWRDRDPFHADCIEPT